MIKKCKNKKSLKVGVAFSGGTALGIAHLGVIKSLRKNRISIDCVSGTSAGSIAAACLAFNLPLKKIIEISKKMNWESISQFGYSRYGINSNQPIRDIITQAFGDVNLEEAEIPIAIVATDIDTGKEIVIQSGKLTEAVAASTCLPGVFVPIEKDGKKLVDGGLVENLPLIPLQKMGAKIRIGVNLKREYKLKKTKNVLDVIRNSYKILSHTQNFLIPSRAEVLIEPNLKKFDADNFNRFDDLMEEGFHATEEKIPNIKKYLRQNFQIKKEKNNFSNIFKIMKKNFLIFAGFLILAVAVLFSVRLFFTNEDSWICTRDGWIKHGNPQEPKPEIVCGGNVKDAVSQEADNSEPVGMGKDTDEHGCVNWIGDEWCPSTGRCQKVWMEYCEEFKDEYRLDFSGKNPDKSNWIRVQNIKPGDKIESPLTVRGRARGTWFFEGSFPVILKDSSGKVLAEGYASAVGEWMTTSFVPFESVVIFQKPAESGEGTLILMKDNPSDQKELDDALELPVKF